MKEDRHYKNNLYLNILIISWKYGIAVFKRPLFHVLCIVSVPVCNDVDDVFVVNVFVCLILIVSF